MQKCGGQYSDWSGFIFKDMAFTIKHLAVSKLNQDKIELRAHPVLIKKDSYLANLKSVRNGIEVETDLLGTLDIAGSVAGQESTASGVISDLVNLANSNDNTPVLQSRSGETAARQTTGILLS